MSGYRRAIGELLARVYETSDAMDKRDASGWLVVCVDLEAVEHGEPDCIVGCYGTFDTPEEALVEAGKHDATSLETPAGWAHFVKPLFPRIEWKES